MYVKQTHNNSVRVTLGNREIGDRKFVKQSRKKVNGRRHLGDQSIDVQILNRILNKYVVMMLIGLSWLRVQNSGGSRAHCDANARSVEEGNFLSVYQVTCTWG